MFNQGSRSTAKKTTKSKDFQRLHDLQGLLT